MKTFYAEQVHSHIHADPTETLAKYRRRIHAELAGAGIDIRKLRDKTILDIGSGWQTIVFAELGCRQIFHLDFSPRHVEFVRRYAAENRLSNIVSTTTDVCLSLGQAQDIDLAFITGVYHHLPDREGFLGQLLPAMAPGADILFRVYRSGTWSRWLVSLLRTASSSRLTPDALFTAYQMLRPQDADRQFVGDMIDDLLTPHWQAFHPDQFRTDAVRLGLICNCEESDFDFDFSDRDENFRIVWHIAAKGAHTPSGTLATGRNHSEPTNPPNWLAEPLLALRALLTELIHRNDLETATVLVALYLTVRRHRDYSAFYGTPYPTPVANGNLAEWRIRNLQQTIRHLRNWLAL